MKNIALAVVAAALFAVTGCSDNDKPPAPERNELDADMAELKATAKNFGKQLDKASRDLDRQLDSAKKDINKQLDGAADAIKGLKFK